MDGVGALAKLHKNPQKFPHPITIFLVGRSLVQISISLLFGAPPFQAGRLFHKSKKACLGLMMGVPHGTNRVAVGPPNSEKRWNKGGPNMAPKG